LLATEFEQVPGNDKQHLCNRGWALRVRVCSKGLSNAAVAESLRLSQQMVCKWQGRFIKKRLDGLLDETTTLGTKASNAQ